MEDEVKADLYTFESSRNCGKSFKEAYRKGRADAIDEVLCKMWQLYEKEERTVDDLRVRRFCNKLAEQLKEEE